MRNSALLLAVVLAASFSTVADAAKKKAPPVDPAAQARTDSAAFVRALANPSNSAAGVDSANFVTAAVTGGLVSPPPPVQRARKSSACGALTVGQCGCRHRVFSYFQSPVFWASFRVPGGPVDNGDLNMRKSALLLAVVLAACFTLTGAEAAKKKAAAKPPAAPADKAYEWNLKNIPPMAAPGAAAAKPAADKKAGKSKKKAKA